MSVIRMPLTNPRLAAVQWVEKHVREHLPGEQQPHELAEALVGIAEHYEVPDEALVEWLHFHREGKEFSAEAFRGWCAKYADTRERILAQARNAICAVCGAELVLLHSGRWFCVHCGTEADELRAGSEKR